MPAIDADRWKALEPFLDRALSLSPEEREVWLGELRSTAPAVAAELDSLLSEKAAADRHAFLAEPLAHRLAGLQLGAYTLEQPLGHGGMGSVWLARRTDGRFEGRAAVKLLNLALLNAAGQERFRREGSLLARLSHPGIARLLDAGVSPSGQPYLVLEYVEGQRIDAFADERRLTSTERIELVLEVLSAVGHAHSNLVVHRDLKPSNILVTADGTAKLLDFGIAKLLAAGGSEEVDALTGDTRLLTPEFAAPEQIRGGAITTATDVYALGVLLYRLLAGRPPYELSGRSAAELERVICETEAPRPSTAFEPAAPGAAERARARGASPARLRHHLRGDLDAIVMTALRKEPERRYSSAAALEDDLRRCLDGRPVLARPNAAAYRIRKFVGRHRALVAIATTVVALLAGAAIRERGLRGRAEAEAHKAEAVKDYLVSVFNVADPFGPTNRKSDDVTARELLDRGAARIDSALGAEPDVQAELRGVLGRVYVSLGLLDKAAPLLRRSLEQRCSLFGPRHAAVAEAMDELGDLLTKQSRFDQAEPLLREGLAQRRALVGSSSEATAASVDHLATLLQERNEYDAAEPLFREALSIQRRLHGPDHEEVTQASNNLALLLVLKGAYAEAEPLYRQALAINSRRLGEDNPLTAQALQNLAQLLENRGRFGEAETFYRRALAAKRKILGNAHPSVTVNLNNLGNMLARDKGEIEKAEPLIREALALDRQMFGEHHEYTAESLRGLATVLRMKGDFDEAERLYRQALALNRSLFGGEHVRIASILNAIAITSHLKGDLDGAVPLFRESLAQYRHMMGDRHWFSAVVSVNLARALLERGDGVEAESLVRAAVSALDISNRRQRAVFVEGQAVLARSLTFQGRTTEALPVVESALQMDRSLFGASDWRTAEALLGLGECLAASGQQARAEQVLREAYATLQAQRRAQPRLAVQAGTALAQLYQALGRPDEARRYRPSRRHGGA